MNLIKKALLVPAALFNFALSANYDSDNDSLYPNEEKPYDSGNYREITPDAGPRVADGVGIFFTADFIYWQAREEGLGYAISGFNGTNPKPVVGAVQQPNFGYKPGFKAGFGLNFSHDGWDFFSQYTWLKPKHTKASALPPIGASLGPYWLLFAPGGTILPPGFPLLFASGDWRLRFNVIDLELGRNFFVSQYLTLRPHAGLKGTWQHQTYIVKYNASGIESIVTFSRMGQHEEMWGIGVRAGLNSSWHVNKTWSIFGDIDLTAMWMDLKEKRRERSKAETQPAPVVTLNVQNHFKTIKPVLELSLGLRWELWFFDDAYHVMFQGAWEQQIWWSRNQLIGLFEEGAHGDLTLHGLTVKGQFDF